MRRRQLLTASAVAIAGVAGCLGGTGSENGENEPTPGGLESPTGAVYTFYDTLFGEDDIEATNDLYHPESPAPELVTADFEPFGGVENIQSDIQNVEVVSESEGRRRVHTDIDYSTPVGSSIDEDWFVFRQHEGEWKVSMWLPASARSDMDLEEQEQAMESA